LLVPCSWRLRPVNTRLSQSPLYIESEIVRLRCTCRQVDVRFLSVVSVRTDDACSSLHGYTAWRTLHFRNRIGRECCTSFLHGMVAFTWRAVNLVCKALLDLAVRRPPSLTDRVHYTACALQVSFSVGWVKSRCLPTPQKDADSLVNFNEPRHALHCLTACMGSRTCHWAVP
jgi:hypothetical protein